MKGRVTIDDVLKLTVEERLVLVEQIWGSITGVPQAVEVTEAQRVELERRLAAYHQEPTAG